LQVKAACRQDERLVGEIAKIHRLLLREAVILSNRQHIGHLEKSLVRELGFIALEHREYGVDLLFGEKPRQLLTIIIDNLRGHVGICPLERIQEVGDITVEQQE
jgi:hypothetical protein